MTTTNEHSQTHATFVIERVYDALPIAVLLLILVFVGLNALTESTYPKQWRGSIQVALYPVNADGSEVAAGHQAATF